MIGSLVSISVLVKGSWTHHEYGHNRDQGI